MAKETLEWSGGSITTTKDLKEIVEHGDLLFHMSAHLTEVPKNQDIILYCHWHEELELCFVTKGAARFQVNNTFYDVHKGEVVLIMPNEFHAAYPVDKNEVEFYAILVHFDFVASLLNDLVQKKYICPLFSHSRKFPVFIDRKAEERFQLLPLLLDIIKIYKQESFGYELLIKARVYEVFYRLSVYAEEIEPPRDEHETYKTLRIKTIVQYIQQNYTCKISLSDLAKNANISTGYLCRFFKEYLNMTPVEYLNSLRITQAVHLIETTDKKFTDIALDTGFNDVNYFTTVFKKMLHCTPTEYKLKISSMK